MTTGRGGVRGVLKKKKTISSGQMYAVIRPVPACAKGITAVLSSGSLLHDIQPNPLGFALFTKYVYRCVCARINLNQICRINSISCSQMIKSLKFEGF